MSAIDVSAYQGSINWAKVKAAGVTAALIKCGYGQDYKSQDDKYFKANMDGALAQGIKVGVYIYSYATSEAMGVGEANHLIRLVAPYKDRLTYPVFIDIEEQTKIKYCKSVCKGFLSTMHNAGYKAGIYTTTSVYKDYLKNISGCDMWWIAWLGQSAPSYADIWQYSWKGRVSGISGDVDMDKIIHDVGPNPKPSGGTYEVKVRTIYYRSTGVLTGEDVKSVQKIVGATADGQAGKKTDAAIRSWQKKNGLTVDGMFGPKCWDYSCGAR